MTIKELIIKEGRLFGGIKSEIRKLKVKPLIGSLIVSPKGKVVLYDMEQDKLEEL